MAERMRRIVVDGQPFRWRFDDVLVVIPGQRSGPQLYVDWGWRDWMELEGPGAEPLVACRCRLAFVHVWFFERVGHPRAFGPVVVFDLPFGHWLV